MHSTIEIQYNWCLPVLKVLGGAIVLQKPDKKLPAFSNHIKSK